MKTLVIALKDLTRSFRSAFALMFMFVVPLMVTGMFYLMFGNITSSDADSQAQVPVTKVVVANLDRGSEALAQGMSAMPGITAKSIGEVIVQVLQGDAFAATMAVSIAPDAAAARRAVDSQQAGIAVIIPENFSAAFADPTGQAVLEMYQDPTLTVGPQVVQSILGSLMDTFSGVRIAASVTMARGDFAEVGPVVQQYLASSGQVSSPNALLKISAPEKVEKASSNPITQVVGPIMAGMMIFFAFFTGGSSAQGILQEDENGTLPRLFTTPTPKSAILGGKFLAVGLTVLVQVSLLLVFAALVFHIAWGSLVSVMMAAFGIVTCASAFGIFLTSLLKSTKQGGVVYGGLMTVTGMLGMLPIFTGGSSAGTSLETISLLMPQGWAVRALSMSMNGAGASSAVFNLLVLLALSLVFFGAGVWRFQKRYA